MNHGADGASGRRETSVGKTKHAKKKIDDRKKYELAHNTYGHIFYYIFKNTTGLILIRNIKTFLLCPKFNLWMRRRSLRTVRSKYTQQTNADAKKSFISRNNNSVSDPASLQNTMFRTWVGVLLLYVCMCVKTCRIFFCSRVSSTKGVCMRRISPILTSFPAVQERWCF